MAFIDVFKVETEHRSIYGVPSKEDRSSKMYVLEYLITKVPDNTTEKFELEYLYGQYNIGESITTKATDPTLGPPVPNASPFVYLKLDGSNEMDNDYVPINLKHVVTLDYFNSNGVGLSLGETDTTAYRGDRGLIAYTHSQTLHAPSNAETNRTISDSLVLLSSTTSASSTAVKSLQDNKSETTHNHDLIYEPINTNIQTHIADNSLHITILEDFVGVPAYTGNEGKLLKVNPTGDGVIWGNPSGTTVSWGDVSGTLASQTDLQTALDGKVDNAQVLTDVIAGALFTDTVYNDTSVVEHIGTFTGNPHSVTSTDIGLPLVDNTSDIEKPISTLTQTALDAKQSRLLTSFTINTAYTTLNANTSQSGIVETGGSVTIDSANDGGLGVGYVLEIFNNTSFPLAVSIAAGDSILGDNINLAVGYFATYMHIGAGVWTVDVDGKIDIQTSVNIIETPSDVTVSGITMDSIVGENVTFGDALYIKADGKLWKGDADDVNTFPIIALAAEAILADAIGRVLLLGTAADLSWTFTIGVQIYMSAVPGELTQTKPVGIGDIVQVLGVATAATRILFNPNITDVVTSVLDITAPAVITFNSVV